MMTRGTPRLSIPTRIFVGFSLVLAAFVAVSVASLVQHERTSRTLRLLHEGYLPLALTLGEAKATQAVFGTLLDRVLAEQDAAATRSWLNAARRVRPATIRRAVFGLSRAERLATEVGETGALDRVRAALDRVDRAHDEGEHRYDALFHALDAGEGGSAGTMLEDQRHVERRIQAGYRDAWRELQELIAMTSRDAAERERRATWGLGAMAVLALLVGLVVTAWVQRLLAPLGALHRRVGEIARGESTSPLRPVRHDEIGRLTEELELMVERLAERDARLREAAKTERFAAIGRMAAHVTHEIRNPLSSIGLNVELLQEELGGAAGEPKALLAAIQKEIDRLRDLTEQYLRLARLPGPQLEVEDLGEIVQSVASFVRPEMEAAGVELRLRVADGLPACALDEQQIRQALLNLLRNAREAMPGGGAIDLEVEPDDRGLHVRVRDRGPGIPDDVREKVFDLFYTTKEHGTGLGLPLTQQVVVAHGGRIRCHGDATGTTFEIWLPAASSESSASDENRSEERTTV